MKGWEIHCISLHNNQIYEVKLGKNDCSVHTLECTVKYVHRLI